MKNHIPVITVDIESFYDKDYSLSKMTTEAYVNDKRFEVIGVGVKVNSAETKTYSGSKMYIAGVLAGYNWKGSYVLAHNTLFDATILSYGFGIKPKMWLDTLSMARALHGTEVGGSLKALAEYYQVGEKGSEVMNALGKRRMAFSEAELTAYMDYCKNDVDLTYEIFKLMAPAFNKEEIKLIDLTLRMHTEPKLLLDLPTLEDHLYRVKKKKEDLLAKAAIDKSELMSNPKFAEALIALGVTPPTKISLRTGKEAYAFAKSDEAMKELLEHDNPDVQALVAARIGTKSTLEETRTQRFIEMACRFGKLPVPLKYYGAMTGRWAATDKTNLQNIPRGSVLKEAIVAPEGWQIVGADLSNIELRVGLYFAGQLDKLELLATGTDLYKDFASSVFNVAYDEVDDDQRFIGKTSQLSLIYGTGPAKLRSAIKMMGNRDIGEIEAKRIVDIYRSEYASVKAAWYEGEKTLKAMHKGEACTFGSALPLRVMGSYGIELPSGLYLKYPGLKQIEEGDRKEWRYTVRKDEERIHGPKTFQNTIQALARCVMGESMVRIAKKLPIAITIHDAVYCVVPDQLVERAKRFIVDELKRPPEWAAGLPLDAEVGAGQTLAFKMKKLDV